MNVLYPFPASFLDYPDGDNISILVFVMGCDFHCIGCHNPAFQNPAYETGTLDLDAAELCEEIVVSCMRNRTNKVVLTGGDPLSGGNRETTKEVVRRLGDRYDIAIYTGNNIDYVRSLNIRGFKFVKCGQFVRKLEQPSEKTDDYMTFASKNQQLYDSQLQLLTSDGKYVFQGSPTHVL